MSSASISSSNLSIHTARSNLSDNVEVNRVEALEAIAEENNRILQGSGRRNEPFNWGNVTNELTKMIKKEYNMSKLRRNEHIREWENRDRGYNPMGSTPDLSKPTNDDNDQFFSFGKSLRKDKTDEHPALANLREMKKKRTEKANKKIAMEREKEKLYAIAKAKVWSEYDAYPPPPYCRNTYSLPDNMYEELQLKRLIHGLYTTSDPEDTRRKHSVYPALPEDDYTYVQTAQLRRWIKDEVKRQSTESSSSSDEENTIEVQKNNQTSSPSRPKVRPRQPLPKDLPKLPPSTWKNWRLRRVCQTRRTNIQDPL